MNNPESKFKSPTKRKQLILNLLKDAEYVSCKQIREYCGVSDVTIRRDLAAMEKEGLLIRTHGGAKKRKTIDYLFSYDDKMNLNKEKKEHIGRVAGSLVKPHDIIFIDCGSTVSFLTRHLTKITPLTVITNSLPIISELISHENIKIILIGGEINNKRKAVHGYSAMQNISQYNATKAFIGADAISLSNGLTSLNERIASITLKMAENSDQVFLLCDSTKIEKDSLVKFAPLSIVSAVVTDNNVRQDIVRKYQDRGIPIICEALS